MRGTMAVVPAEIHDLRGNFLAGRDDPVAAWRSACFPTSEVIAPRHRVRHPLHRRLGSMTRGRCKAMPTTTTADGVELFVKDWGEEAPLLFLHSAALSNEIWQYQHAHFAEARHRVVAFDRRGHGRSDRPSTGYDADTLADDVAHVIAARALEGVTLVGHSMACAEIVRYLARHGAEKIARIILV